MWSLMPLQGGRTERICGDACAVELSDRSQLRGQSEGRAGMSRGARRARKPKLWCYPFDGHFRQVQSGDVVYDGGSFIVVVQAVMAEMVISSVTSSVMRSTAWARARTSSPR